MLSQKVTFSWLNNGLQIPGSVPSAWATAVGGEQPVLLRLPAPGTHPPLSHGATRKVPIPRPLRAQCHPWVQVPGAATVAPPFARAATPSVSRTEREQPALRVLHPGPGPALRLRSTAFPRSGEQPRPQVSLPAFPRHKPEGRSAKVASGGGGGPAGSVRPRGVSSQTLPCASSPRCRPAPRC